jgi:diguanylate cyclase (GGDEF)-like protein
MILGMLARPGPAYNRRCNVSEKATGSVRPSKLDVLDDADERVAICNAFDPVFKRVEQLALACDLQGFVVATNPVFQAVFPGLGDIEEPLLLEDVPFGAQSESLKDEFRAALTAAANGAAGFVGYEHRTSVEGVDYVGWSTSPVCAEDDTVEWILVQSIDLKNWLARRADLAEANVLLEEEVQTLKRRSTDLEWSVDTLEGQGNVLVEIADEGELIRIELAAEIEQRKRLEAELTRIAITDPLTGIFNRRRWMEVGSEELARMQNGYRPFSIISFDVDHFKAVNDTWSHQAGDDVLIALATICKTTLGDLAERFFRTGGEEFICLVQATNVDAASRLAEQLQSAIEQMEVVTCGETLSVTASFGVTECVPGESLSSVLSRADKALFQAKDHGRNCCVRI